MKSVIFKLGTSISLLAISNIAVADIDRGGVLNEVSDKFLTQSSAWATTITAYASWLFWTLVVISMVWTFGMMALRKADLGEFFAELTRFTITTGFFWWLLINGPNFSMDIINSLRTIAAEASGLPRGLNPSTPIDIAFDIIAKAARSYSITSPLDNLSIFLITLAILACMAIVAANVLLALVTAWILAYAGIFVLGFGGSRWTSDIAINYFRSVAGIALKIMTITLLVGIAVSIIDGYHHDLSEGAPLDELLVIFVVSLVMVILVNSVPNVVAGLIPGGSSAASAGSSFGAGAVIGAAAGAGTAVASGGVALGGAAMSGASNIAGGAQALKAAFSKANESVANGSDLLSAFSGGGDGSYSNGSDGGDSGTGDTPFAQAAGFDSGSQRASDSAQSASSSSSGQGSSDTATTSTNGGNGSQDQGSDTATAAAATTTTGGFMAGAGRAGRVAADTGANLAKGVAAVAKAKAGSMKGKAMQRIGNTTGGKIAAAIKAQGQGGAAAENAGGSGTPSEPTKGSDNASFANDSLSGGDSTGGGWMNQTGGFDNLSSEQQEQAIQSHAQWQENDPENHTFDVGDYVSYTQERNAEVASFVNKGRP